MTNGVWSGIVGVAGTLLGATLGWVLSRLSQLDDERRRRSASFKSIKTCIMLEDADQLQPVHLHMLREFLVGNAELLERTEFAEFFSAWLNSYDVKEGTPCDVPSRDYAKLKKELAALRI